MAKLKKIYQYIDSMAPFETQMDFDNSGLLLGDKEAEISRVLVALDVTMDVAKEAVRRKCQLIVSHHPLIFHPLRTVTNDDPVGAVVLTLTKHNIAVISAHTNLDLAPLGVSNELLKRLDGRVTGILEPMGNINPTGAYARPYGLGRIGVLREPVSPKEFALRTKKALNARGVRAVLGDRTVEKLAVCGGSGGDLIRKAAEADCDAYVTADVKYHEFLEARELGITLIDAGHFATENPMMETLWDWLKCCYEGEGMEVLLSKVHKDIYYAP